MKTFWIFITATAIAIVTANGSRADDGLPTGYSRQFRLKLKALNHLYVAATHQKKNKDKDFAEATLSDSTDRLGLILDRAYDVSFGHTTYRVIDQEGRFFRIYYNEHWDKRKSIVLYRGYDDYNYRWTVFDIIYVNKERQEIRIRRADKKRGLEEKGGWYICYDGSKHKKRFYLVDEEKETQLVRETGWCTFSIEECQDDPDITRKYGLGWCWEQDCKNSTVSEKYCRDTCNACGSLWIPFL